MKPKVHALGGPVARERRDGGQVKLSTFIPLKIRKRGASKVVVRPDGAVESPGKVASQIDQPLLVALTLFAGKKVIPLVLRYVARTGARDLFTLAVLVIALCVALYSA